LKFKRIVIKVGSAVLSENGEISKERILNIVSLIAELKSSGAEVVLVSSGAVSAGYTKVKLDKSVLANRQALASIGQQYLMSIYHKKFEKFGINIAQVLMIENDFDSKKRSENAKRTVEVLLKNGIVPIVNENDTVAIEELTFGDNDQLSAHSTLLFDGEILIILSDIDGYYDKNPKEFSDAKMLKFVYEIEEKELLQEVSPNNEFATGGIVTKLKSAHFLQKNGIPMFLTSGFNLENLRDFLFQNRFEKGTLFKMGVTK
jgi:glutamate 5-kinase